MNDLKYRVGIALMPGIGHARFLLLEKFFGDLEKAWRAPGAELTAAGLDERSVHTVVSYRPRVDLDQEMERLERLGIDVLSWHDQRYPSILKEIYDYPPVLYLKGSLLPEDRRAVAVVGTRKVSAYGKEVASRLTTDLARQRITIISGLARGVDGIAHRSALEAGGRTVAVLPCGLDRIYPPEHAALAQAIAEMGCLVSEYSLGTRPDASHFPRRNRIMSGLSLGTLIVEAGDNSGALWTAHHALEQNREVFAVPGSIFSPGSVGVHRLLQDGAKLVTNVNDILEELNLTAVVQQYEMKELLPETNTEALVLQHLSQEPQHIDELRRATGLPIATVSSTLAMMEVNGLVRQVGVMSYIAAQEAAMSRHEVKR